MDPNTKADIASWLTKAIKGFLGISPPVILANVTHWAATVLTGKKVSLRARVAIFLGSFSIAYLVHYICTSMQAARYEWVFIWSTSMGAEQLLRFFYLEFGEMLKTSVRVQIATIFKLREKKQ